MCVCTRLCACERLGSLLTWERGPTGDCSVALWGGGGGLCPRDWGGSRALQRGSSGSRGRTRQDHSGDRDLGVAQITFENGNFILQEEGLGGSQCGVEAAGRRGGAPGQRMSLRDRLGMLTEMAGPCGKRGSGGPGLLPGNWGLGALWGAWGQSRSRDAHLVPLPLLASQMESGTRTLVGSCTEPAFWCRGQTHCSTGRGRGLPMDGEVWMPGVQGP